VATAVLILLAGAAALAENIDPDDDGSQYGYGENVGWVNLEPSGAGGPGVQVDDFELSGYLWGENVGWVSLSCKNGSTCDSVEHGVRNDGSGTLSGYGWSENLGWINFAPETAGVQIDVVTGAFSGRAWGENVGWITFASSAVYPFQVKTGWTCDPAPTAPSGSPALTVARSGSDAHLSWTAPAAATGYDVVTGELSTLRNNSGDFGLATTACSADNRTSTSLTHAETPAPGDGSWFLVRPANCGGPGDYESDGTMQAGPRSGAIGASGNQCP
jgi:hypothetical protein